MKYTLAITKENQSSHENFRQINVYSHLYTPAPKPFKQHELKNKHKEKKHWRDHIQTIRKEHD